jgi:integrase
MPLTARRAQTLNAPGLYGDGGNLWLKVSGPGRRSWVFRYTLAARARSMGLGNANEVSLAEARNRADAARKLLREGTDPIEARNAARAVPEACAHTFAEVTALYLNAHAAAWRSERHRRLWRASMANHVLPIIGTAGVAQVGTNDVLRVLERLWQTKPATASRIRSRIEAVLSYATARGWRSGQNAAAWRGHLALTLPQRTKLRPVEHFAALDWREAPVFIAELRERASVHARALEFLVLTAARPGEVRGATWDEIDLVQAVWAIPAGRMKGARPHRVPLSAPALALLKSMRTQRAERGLIFPGQFVSNLLSSGVFMETLRRMGRPELTAHGFRSTFRDWAAEATGYPNHVVEQALAHTIGNAVEAAYRRGDLFAKRVALMDDWAAYLARPSAVVVPLRHPPVEPGGMGLREAQEPH